jgi:pimeloyl-ACP methyl ester carboxylesterase
VRVDRDVYPSDVDPSDALGTDVQEVQYTSPAGTFDAWYVPGASDDKTDWVIFVHGGLGSDRSEALRAMHPTTKLGLPSLAIAYRNDAGAPQDDSGRYQYGRTEWRDLEGAVRYALDHDATGVRLVGDSMGGAIAAAFLERSELASKVTRVVLDSPNLDLQGTVEYGAEQLTLPVVGSPPSSLVWVAEQLAAARYDLDWDAMDYLDDTSWVRVPTLVFQGIDDETAPMAAAEQLRYSHPELVTLAKVNGAGHMEAWNADTQGYQRQLIEFLSSS